MFIDFIWFMIDIGKCDLFLLLIFFPFLFHLDYPPTIFNGFVMGHKFWAKKVLLSFYGVLKLMWFDIKM